MNEEKFKNQEKNQNRIIKRWFKQKKFFKPKKTFQTKLKKNMESSKTARFSEKLRRIKDFSALKLSLIQKISGYSQLLIYNHVVEKLKKEAEDTNTKWKYLKVPGGYPLKEAVMVFLYYLISK